MVFGSFIGPVLAGAGGEFGPDANTLFLAHYNTSLNADYSQGPSKPDPADPACLTRNNGYFGGGLVGRVGAEALKEAGADLGISSLMPKSFDGVRYPLAGNLDLVKGTFECWYKPYFSVPRAEKMPKDWPMEYMLFTYRETYPSSLSLGINYYGSGTGSAAHVFYHVIKEQDVAPINAGIDWKPGTWHHVAVIWDTTEEPGAMALFLDGKLAQKQSLAPLKKGFLKQAGEQPYFCIGSCLYRRGGNEFQFYKADGVIDEVRISNIVRYKENFALPEKPPPADAGK